MLRQHKKKRGARNEIKFVLLNFDIIFCRLILYTRSHRAHTRAYMYIKYSIYKFSLKSVCVCVRERADCDGLQKGRT